MSSKKLSRTKLDPPMPKISNILLFLIGFLWVVSSTAQTIHLEKEQVPAEVKINFKKKYPQAEDPIWEKMDNGLYSGQFWDINNDIYINAYYEEDGTWSNSIMELDTNAFTEAIRRYMKKNYTTATINNVIVTQEPAGKMTYKIILETTNELITLWMNKQAQVLEKVEETINFNTIEE